MQVEKLDATVVNYINELETENKKLKANIVELNQYKNKYFVLEEQYALLVYRRFVRNAEQLPIDEKQQLLFVLEEAETKTSGQDETEELTEVKSYNRKKPGRKPLSEKLERRETIIDISEEEKVCTCGAKMTRIGEETSEKLQIIPQQIYVEQIVRPKYACRCCEGVETEDIAPTVRIAPVPPSIIPKGIASPSLLSTIFTYKFERHLPYYRQERLYEQIGATISRQDMSNWQQQVYQKLSPLFELLKNIVKSGPVLQMDETTVQVIGEEDRKDTQKSYMWLARGGPPDKKVIWYEYHPTRAAYNAKDFLQGYSGYLQTDGYEGYDAAVRGMSGIIHVGCFAHARRKFFEASKATKKPKSAEEGMKYIRKLYNIENELRVQCKGEESFLAKRKKQAEPILEDFKRWLLKRSEEVPPTLLLGKAINYCLTQWDKMTAYLESPYLTPDNNACENAIRPFVLGRKNWLFSQSPRGAESSCGMYTLIQTAKQNSHVPFQYLMTLFEKAPLAVSSEDWEKLLPWNIFTV
jgi:transposase